MYEEFTSESIIDYVKKRNILSGNILSVEEVGNGNINRVFRIFDEVNKESIIIKQALPYLKVAGEGWELTKDRTRIEAMAIQYVSKYCLFQTTKLLQYDEEMAALILEDLSDMSVLRDELMIKKAHSHVGPAAAKYLAKTHFYSTDLYLSGKEKGLMISEFDNPELNNITEMLIFTDPYQNKETNVYPSELEESVREMHSKCKLKLEVTKLKEQFMSHKQALLHGDLHTGSIFVDEDRIKIFDFEFSTFGPIGFDLGVLFANYILNLVSAKTCYGNSFEDKYSYDILNIIYRTFSEFEKIFRELFYSEGKEEFTCIDGFIDSYLEKVMIDSIGFAGCEIIRRIIGLAHVEDIDTIDDKQSRVNAQKTSLKIGEYLIINRMNIKNLDEFLLAITEILDNRTIINDNVYSISC